MDNNPVAPQVNDTLIQIPPTKSNLGRNLLMIFSAVLIVFILAGTGYVLFLSSFKKPVSNKIQVYNQSNVKVKPTITPTPSVYQINLKDTSDNAINNDTTTANENLNNLDSDMNNVDQSFNDQQTNLQ